VETQGYCSLSWNLRIYVKEAWEQITEEQLNSLIDSMRERCLAIIEAQGGLQSSEIKYKPLPPLQTLGAPAPPTKYRPDTIVILRSTHTFAMTLL